ncbi:hypothetical protein NUW58_g8155 [Xylaria curta]|uniref:Uncharacterized protein n=1 Tax=Xylaria curta TaxID=42375 RepID=A0ACC1NBC1_9PEZI|nr:hypothetical protein NUW58_g8155 [Xylaria curta]
MGVARSAQQPQTQTPTDEFSSQATTGPRNRPKRPPTSPPELALTLRGRNQHVSRFGYKPPASLAKCRERRVCPLLSALARSRVLVTGADSGRSSITIGKTDRVPLRPAYGNCLAMARVAGRRTTIDPHRLPWLRDGFLSGRGPTAIRRRPPMTTSHPPGVAVVQWAYSQGEYQWFIKRRRAEREERVEFRVGVPFIKRPFLMVRLWEFNSQDRHPSELFALATERGADLQAMRRIIDAHLPERKCG